MSPSTGRFRRTDRLRRPAEFQRVTRHGRRVAGADFVVIALARVGEPGVRLGITTSRKLGNAVARNYVKRQVREWFRAERSALAGVGDLVVIGRKSAAKLSQPALRGELDDLGRRLTQRPARGGVA